MACLSHPALKYVLSLPYAGPHLKQKTSQSIREMLECKSCQNPKLGQTLLKFVSCVDRSKIKRLESHFDTALNCLASISSVWEQNYARHIRICSQLAPDQRQKGHGGTSNGIIWCTDMAFINFIGDKLRVFLAKPPDGLGITSMQRMVSPITFRYSTENNGIHERCLI